MGNCISNEESEKTKDELTNDIVNENVFKQKDITEWYYDL